MTYKATIAIGLALTSLAGYTLGWGGRDPGNIEPVLLVRDLSEDGQSKQWSSNLNASGVRHVRVEVQLGEVHVSTRRGGDFHADFTKTVSKNPSSLEREWLNNDWIQTQRDGDTIVISEIESKKPKFEGRDGDKSHRLDFKANIQIPEGLDVQTKVMAGTIDVKGSLDSLIARVDAGELTLDNLACRQALQLKVGAGSVDAKLAQTPGQNSAIEVGVGDINFNLKGNANLDVNVGIGGIDGGSKSDDDEDGLGSQQTIQVGTGGPSIRLKVGAGNVSIGQGKTIKKSSKKGGHDFQFNFKGDWNKDMDKDIEKEISDALKSADVEVKRALAEAQKEIDKARKDTDREADLKDLSPEVQAIARDAMKVAQRALDLANKELQKALKKSLKENRSEKI